MPCILKHKWKKINLIGQFQFTQKRIILNITQYHDSNNNLCLCLNWSQKFKGLECHKERAIHKIRQYEKSHKIVLYVTMKRTTWKCIALFITWQWFFQSKLKRLVKWLAIFDNVSKNPFVQKVPTTYQQFKSSGRSQT